MTSAGAHHVFVDQNVNSFWFSVLFNNVCSLSCAYTEAPVMSDIQEKSLERFYNSNNK